LRPLSTGHPAFPIGPLAAHPYCCNAHCSIRFRYSKWCSRGLQLMFSQRISSQVRGLTRLQVKCAPGRFPPSALRVFQGAVQELEPQIGRFLARKVWDQRLAGAPARRPSSEVTSGSVEGGRPRRSSQSGAAGSGPPVDPDAGADAHAGLRACAATPVGAARAAGYAASDVRGVDRANVPVPLTGRLFSRSPPRISGSATDIHYSDLARARRAAQGSHQLRRGRFTG
jgi:hypothetical protein